MSAYFEQASERARQDSGSAPLAHEPAECRTLQSLAEYAPPKVLERRGIYVASKVKHAPMWRRLQSYGERINATWIYEAGAGQTADHAELAARCLREVAQSEAVILYCEPREILKGALIEAGAALALGIPVYCVGTCESLSARTFSKHPLWREAATVNDASEAILHARLDRKRQDALHTPSASGAEPPKPIAVALDCSTTEEEFHRDVTEGTRP